MAEPANLADFGSPHNPVTSRRSWLFKQVIRQGLLRSVVLITGISVLGSVLISVAILGLSGEGLQLMYARSWALTIGTPLVIAPLASMHLLRVLLELDKAQRLAYSLAITDGLTGLFNRRYFMSMAQTEWSKACRHATPLSIIMVDADRFKGINDTHGHHVGDLVLQSLADAAKSCLREHDVLARYGGEELIFLLPHTDLAGAVTLAERIRSTVEQTRVAFGTDQNLNITVSLGVSTLTPACTSLTELLKLADEALYRAKEQGRNQVQMAPGGAAEATCCVDTVRPPQTGHL